MTTGNRKGFTTVDMVLALIILSILIAVSVPAVSRLSSAYKLQKLDRTSESLYLCAQNKLAYMQTYGNYSKISDFYKKCGDLQFVRYDELNAEIELVGETEENIMYGGSAVYLFDKDGNGLIGVFFSENNDGDSLKERCAALMDLSFEARLSEQIGFYGEKGENTIMPRTYSDPVLTVENGDELTVSFVCDRLNAVRREDIKADLILHGEGDAQFEAEINDIIFYDGQITGSFTVDKVTVNGSSYYIDNFAGHIGKPEKVVAEVIITYKNSHSMTDRVCGKSEPFSPLFENNSGGKIDISCARHFNNIRYADENAEFFQTSDINFDTFPCIFTPLPIFSGNFDGGDRIISNIDINGSGIFSELNGQCKNLHIVGASVKTDNTSQAGVICGKLNGSLYNCSVSESEISADNCDGSYIGGLAGILSGTVSNCSADCDVACSSQNVNIGGIAGFLEGQILSCRSSGKTAFSTVCKNSRIAGIAAGGSGQIDSSLSERWAEYIGTADFYGICPDEVMAESSFFILENGWLDKSYTQAVSENSIAELSIQGFKTAGKIYINGKYLKTGSPQECVTVSDSFVRFGEYRQPSPRGLIGAVKITYSDGKFVSERLASFDGFGNASSVCPEIMWESPYENEVRYYVFLSSFISPGRGEPGGWEFTFDRSGASLGEKETVGYFEIMRITGADSGGTAVLSFASASESFEIEADTEEISEGQVGVAAVMYTDIIDFYPNGYMDGLHYKYNSMMYNMETGELQIPEPTSYQTDEFGFETPNLYETKLFIVASENLVIDKDWSCSSSKGMIIYEFTRNGFNYYSVDRVLLQKRKSVYTISINCKEQELTFTVNIMGQNAPTITGKKT